MPIHGPRGVPIAVPRLGPSHVLRRVLIHEPRHELRRVPNAGPRHVTRRASIAVPRRVPVAGPRRLPRRDREGAVARRSPEFALNLCLTTLPQHGFIISQDSRISLQEAPARALN